ncbi:unnamed protein product [Musa acuminata subsp. malaccensis]|uniref:(wild Malaysian banana) hypothetical protein n=1 Tax=Musa acuminata subsp. malaccensis TaxID=214687 RepID=A0A8D6ZTR7_MUSAM|nr:unnamed protein product [Musa acuminata subsp. malaccensis]
MIFESWQLFFPINPSFFALPNQLFASGESQSSLQHRREINTLIRCKLLRGGRLWLSRAHQLTVAVPFPYFPATPDFFKQKLGKGSELGEGETTNPGPAYTGLRSKNPNFLGRSSGPGPSRLVGQKTESAQSGRASAGGDATGFNCSPRFRIFTSSMTRTLLGRVMPSVAPSFSGDGHCLTGRGGLALGGGDGVDRGGQPRPGFIGVVADETGGFFRWGFVDGSCGERDPKASRCSRPWRQSWDRSTAAPIGVGITDDDGIGGR